MIEDKILNRIELIVFDLDGTLLRSDNTIGGRTIKYVSELQNFGVQFSFASGRLHSAIINHAETLNINAPLISLDGAIITSYPDNRIIYESYVPQNLVKKAINLADKNFLKIALCHNEAIYFTEQNSAIPQMLEKFGAKYKMVHSYQNFQNNVLEIVLAGDNKETIRKVYKELSFPFSFGLTTSFYKSHRKQEIYYLEIRKKGNNKGLGFKRLAKYFGIKTKYAAVMGDWYNDISLFRTNALKVAVANAVPDLKRMADFITKNNNDEDAAADFLELVLKSKKNKK